MRKDEEKDVVYISLKSALMEEGCPICLLVSKRRDQWIETLFYELVTSSETRRKLREGASAHIISGISWTISTRTWE